MILIAIPSKGRAKEIIKHTYSYLQYTNVDCKIFVEPKEVDDYMKAGVKPEFIVQIGLNNQGLNYAKQFIFQYAKQHAYKYIFKLDDDLRSISEFKTMGRGHQGKVDKETKCKSAIDVFCQHAVELLEEQPQIGGIALMYAKQMYGKVLNEIRKGSNWILFNKRFESNYVVRIEHFCPVKYTTSFMGFYEDFVVFFNLMNQGYFTVTYSLVGLDVYYVGQNTGGHQSFNRMLLSEQEIAYIQKNFPWVEWKTVVGKKWRLEPDIQKTKNKTKNYQRL